MFESVAATILIAAFEFTMIAVVAIAPSAMIVWLLRLQSRIYHRAIARHLERGRRRHYREHGLDPTPRFLEELLSFEAAQLLSNGRAQSLKSLPRWTLNLKLRLDASFGHPEVMTDTVDSKDHRARTDIKAELLALVPRLERRFELALLGVCGASGVLLCLLTGYSVLDSLSNRDWTLFVDGRASADWRQWSRAAAHRCRLWRARLRS